MSLLYKQQKDLKYSVDVKTLSNGNLRLSFSADCGKHGCEESLDEYEFSVKQLLSILQAHDAGM